MELHNTFSVPIPVEEAWEVLTDVERIAPCMPGAQLQEVEGDEYRGVVKVKVGPITAQYKGKATFLEKNESDRKAVLRAEGRDTRGQGNANATVTMTMNGEGDRTQVNVDTDLNITGRVAQFGRGVLADVTEKLLGQFVECLETKIQGGDEGSADATAAATPASPAAAPAAPLSESDTTPSGLADRGAAADQAASDDAAPAGAESPADRPGAADVAAASDRDTGDKDAAVPPAAPAAPTAPAAAAPTEPAATKPAYSGPAASEPTVDVGAAGAAAVLAAGSAAGGPERPPADDQAGRTQAAAPGVRTIDHPEPEPIDVLDSTPDYVKVGAAGVGALLVAIILFLLLRRKQA